MRNAKSDKNLLMSLLKPTLLLAALLLCTTSYCQYTDVINSNRPGRSMSAFSVGQTVFQAEFGIYGVTEEHSILNTETGGFGSELSLRYGAFLEQLEIIAELDYRTDVVQWPTTSYRRSALKTSTIGGKYLIYDPNKKASTKKPDLYSWKKNNSFSWKEMIPALGVYAGVNINVSGNEFTFKDDAMISPKLMLITQSQFGKNVFVSNIIAERFNSPFPTYSYVATLTHGFSEKWSGFIENQGIKSDFYSDFIIRGGAAYLLAENIQIDAAIGASAKTTPSIMTATIGFSWRFDEMYVPSLIPSGDGEKPAEGKKTKKEKKRKDEVAPE